MSFDFKEPGALFEERELEKQVKNLRFLYCWYIKQLIIRKFAVVPYMTGSLYIYENQACK